MLKAEEIKEAFHMISYDRDDREWPDQRRKAQFVMGWNRGISGEEYNARTLLALTWNNLGYQLGVMFGEHDQETIVFAYQTLSNEFQLASDRRQQERYPKADLLRNRERYFLQIRSRMESVGFVFEKEQSCHHQNRREKELKFVHPDLETQLIGDGHKLRGKKFYLKPLSDEANCAIGLVNGKETPLQHLESFPDPNGIDAFGQVPAWVNTERKPALDLLLIAIADRLGRELTTEADDLTKDYVGEDVPPAKVERVTQAYKRCPGVRRNVLQRAKEHCELCEAIAPFYKSDGSAYLEVHHVIPLETGGCDNVNNAVAICPNCHMRCHHSIDAEVATEELYRKVARLRRPIT